jgi:hypothetical protein
MARQAEVAARSAAAKLFVGLFRLARFVLAHKLEAPEECIRWDPLLRASLRAILPAAG